MKGTKRYQKGSLFFCFYGKITEYRYFFHIKNEDKIIK